MMNRPTSIETTTVTLATAAGDFATAAHNLRQAGLDPTVVTRCPDTHCEACTPATVTAA